MDWKVVAVEGLLPFVALVSDCVENIVLVEIEGKLVSFMAMKASYVECNEVRISDAVVKGRQTGNVKFIAVDVDERASTVSIHEKYRSAVIGIPSFPGTSIFVEWHNRVTEIKFSGNAEAAFIGPETVFGKSRKIAMDDLTELPTDSHISERILRMLRHRRNIVSRTLLVCGSAGTGKSHLVKYLRKNVLECRSLDLLKFIDETEASKTDHIDDVMASFEDGILVIDDLCVLPKQCAHALVPFLDRLLQYSVIIVATSRDAATAFPTVLEAMFPYALSIRSVSYTTRREIIKGVVKSESEMEFVARETSGLSRGELNTVCCVLTGISFDEDNVRSVIKAASSSDKPLLMKPTSESFVGYGDIVREICLFLDVALSSDIDKKALLQFHGLLLHGPSGNGKSLIVQRMCSRFDVPFFVLEFDKVFSRYFGESEKGIRDVFETARFLAPSVIVIEDVDAIGGKRGDDSGVGGRVLATLLNEIDGVTESLQVVVIGTTNSPSLVDTALLRPGRFDRLVELGAPSEEDRVGLFEHLRRSTPVADDVTNASLADMTDGFSCAEIRSLFRYAALRALRAGEISTTAAHFALALDRLQSRRGALTQSS